VFVFDSRHPHPAASASGIELDPTVLPERGGVGRRNQPEGSEAMQRRPIVRAVLSCGVLAGLLAGSWPAAAFTPYRLLVHAVRGPQNAMAFVEDKRLKAHLRRAVLEADPSSALSVSSYVAGGHGYLVGWVEDDAQREKIEQAAQKVSGLISVAVYLPARPTGDDAPSKTAELALKAKLTAALRVEMGADQTNIGVDVLGTHAVLVGVLDSAAKIQRAGQVARETDGVSGITSFLTVPLPSDSKRIHRLLR